MKDRVILITGSSSGIGRAITEIFLKDGATVIGIARSHDKFQPNTKRYKTFSVNVSDLNELLDCLKKIISSHPNLNGLVSNAGYGHFEKLENFSVRQIGDYISTNLTSHLVVTRTILPHFKAQKRGDILFIGSEAALNGAKNGSLYCAAKFGVRGFSQAIREECASTNVRVSLINPGMVRTPFFENLNFRPGDKQENAIEPNDVAIMARNIFAARAGTVFDEINMTPLKRVIKFD
ncbi:MAG: SDR family oxidoreductase [Pseudomonadota bacterium]|nr:SDR family oxidoreductase [Pseudomonadota bacterium]